MKSITIYVSILVLIAVQHNHGATITNNYFFSTSLPDLYKQVKATFSIIQNLINTTITNTVNDLKVAKNIAMTGLSKSGTTNNSLVHEIVTSIFNTITKVEKQAIGRGVDTKTCTNQTLEKLLDIGIDFGAKVAACPIDEGTKAIDIIDKDLTYISGLINFILYTPQAISKCMTIENIASLIECISKCIEASTSTLVKAPTTIISMINNIFAYITVLPTNIVVCAINTSLSAVANATALVFNIATCITGKVLSS